MYNYYGLYSIITNKKKTKEEEEEELQIKTSYMETIIQNTFKYLKNKLSNIPT